MKRRRSIVALFCVIGLGAFAMPAAAAIVNLDVQSGYLFGLPHGGGPPDGGSILIQNLGPDPVTIQHVILTGWTNGTTFDFGPAFVGVCPPYCTAAPITLNPRASSLGAGASSEYNYANPPYAADTSNYGTLTDPSLGLLVSITGLDNSGALFGLQKRDNLPNVLGQNYRLTGCVNTGADVECNGTTGAPYGDMTTVPEPSSLMLLSTGVLGLVGLGTSRRRRGGEAQA